MQQAESHINGEPRTDVANNGPAVREMENVVLRGLRVWHGCASRFLDNTVDAEDAVQDVPLSGYKRLQRFMRQTKMSKWLTAIVINCARMIVCKRQRQLHLSLDERVGQEQEYSSSKQLADSGPAEHYEVPEGGVKARFVRARKNLRKSTHRALNLIYRWLEQDTNQVDEESSSDQEIWSASRYPNLNTKPEGRDAMIVITLLSVLAIVYTICILLYLRG